MTFIRFTDNNPNVVFRSSMKSAASITDIGTNSILEAGAVVTPQGIQPGANGACRFTGFPNSGLLDTQGQFSFEVDTAALTKIWAPTGSTGPVYAGATYMYSHGQTSVPYGRLWVDSPNDFNFEINTPDTHVNTIQMHSMRQSVRSIVTVSWDSSNNVDVYINDVLRSSGVRFDLTAPMFNNIFIGSNRSGAGGTVAIPNVTYSNFLVSSLPVALTPLAGLPNLSYFGDSFVNQANVSGATYFRNNAKHIVDAYTAGRGVLTVGATSGNSGATVVDSGASPLEPFRAAFILTSPEPVVFQAGVNDCLQTNLPAAFQVDLDHHISDILANTVGPIFVGTVPTVKFASGADTPSKVQNVAEANVIIKGAPVRWDAANLTDQGRVVVYDLFSYVGGETPEADVFVGQWSGLGDDVHFTAKGQKMWGELLGTTILNYFLPTGNRSPIHSNIGSVIHPPISSIIR